MRILLAQNSLYYPSHGGGDRSNRLLMEALAARGHECRAVARIQVFGEKEQQRYVARVPDCSVGAGIVTFILKGVEVHVVTNAPLRESFVHQLEAFRPDAILCSTDDPAQLLLEAALPNANRCASARGASECTVEAADTTRTP